MFVARVGQHKKQNDLGLSVSSSHWVVDGGSAHSHELHLAMGTTQVVLQGNCEGECGWA